MTSSESDRTGNNSGLGDAGELQHSNSPREELLLPDQRPENVYEPEGGLCILLKVSFSATHLLFGAFLVGNYRH
jgi:hypothetical protein